MSYRATVSERRAADVIGSAGFAAWIAHLAFWILLAIGWAYQELQPRDRVAVVCLWLAGYFGLPFIPYGAALFSSFVAVLDIALVFMIFKGDVRIG
jgi:hypothetical protein